MFVLDRQWDGGYLDYTCGPGQSRIDVAAWYNLGNVDEAYIERPRSWRLLYNYVREIGPRQVYRKIVSRRQERSRNNKYVSCGIGRIVETFGTRFSVGDQVIFLAPFHPRCVSRVAVPDAFVHNATYSSSSFGADTKMVIRYRDLRREHIDEVRSGWQAWAGWHEYSGMPLDQTAIAAYLRRIEPLLIEPLLSGNDEKFRLLPLDTEPVRERSESSPSSQIGARRAIVFGLGNYAKTAILPNIDPRIVVQTIHELDPTQLGRTDMLPWQADTSGTLRPDETAEVIFIAGFHHTHADLAVKALESGNWAVVEKPVATTRDQLSRLTAALEQSPGRLFVCFHKRYLCFNAFIDADLNIQPGDPVSCHCIVYEIPLPRRHWYNWPNSGSRLISNGCHWIDHFLFVNRFSPTVSQKVWRAANGEIMVMLELANGASFSMVLTDIGSNRIGVQEYVEFRANGCTATIRNGGHYMSESSTALLRRVSINKLDTYTAMYRNISQRIANNEPGDSLESLLVSTQTVLDLEELLPIRAGEKVSA